MFQQVNRFVSQFRELEKREISRTQDEERLLRALKEKLTTADETADAPRQTQRSIAILCLYPQAGASFLAGNIAFALAGKGISVSLGELPGTISYTYFALDVERRVTDSTPHSTAPTSILLMQDNCLRIHVEAPMTTNQVITENDHADWLFRLSKESSIVLVDLSSSWRVKQVDRLLGLVDEIWVVIDTDLARLTRTIVTEEPPGWWRNHYFRIKIIANKWSEKWNRSAIMKKVEGTLSLWNEENPVHVDQVVPLFDGEKTFSAHSKAKLFLEQYPEEESGLASLLSFQKV